ALVRPRGKLVIADLDGNGIFHDPLPASLGPRLERLIVGLKGAFDPYAGRRLYGRFFRAGLHPTRTLALPYHFYPGRISATERENWVRKLEGLRSRGEAALGGAEAY